LAAFSFGREPCGEGDKALMLREAPTKLTMIDPNDSAPCFIKDERPP